MQTRKFLSKNHNQLNLTLDLEAQLGDLTLTQGTDKGTLDQGTAKGTVNQGTVDRGLKLFFSTSRRPLYPSLDIKRRYLKKISGYLKKLFPRVKVKFRMR